MIWHGKFYLVMWMNSWADNAETHLNISLNFTNVLKHIFSEPMDKTKHSNKSIGVVLRYQMRW